MKKKILEPTGLGDELSEFTHFSLLEPAYASLYTSLGISLLESLVRLKPISFATETVWKNLFKLLEQVTASAETFQLGEILEEFIKFLNELKKSEKPAAKRLIDKSFGPQGRVNLEISVKLVVYACLDKSFEAIMAGSLQPEQVLTEFSKKVGVHIVHFIGESYKIYKSKNIAPLIFVCSKKNHFGVIYHCLHLKCDEKQENLTVDYKRFPFLHNPATKLQLMMPPSSENMINKFLDLFSLLSCNLKPLDTSSQIELRKLINSLKVICPDSDSKLQELYQKSISLCGHQGKEYTPACLQSHCEKCLVNSVLHAPESKVLCPCGVPLDSSDISFLSGSLKTPKSKEIKFLSNSESPKKTLYKNDPLAKRNSAFASTISKLPTLHEKKVCGICRNQIKRGNFKAVQCNGHVVCLDCRAKRITKGSNNCPLCGRKYTDEENIKLRMRNGSVDLTASLFKATTFIDSL